MKACAAFERSQPGIDSPVGVSQYAVGPSASTRAGPAFVLPAQRPASPEIAESPSVTTTGVPTPGPPADAGAAAPRTTATTTNTNRRIMHPPTALWTRRAYAPLQQTATFSRALVTARGGERAAASTGQRDARVRRRTILESWPPPRHRPPPP